MLPYKELNVYQNIKDLIASVYQILRHCSNGGVYLP